MAGEHAVHAKKVVKAFTDNLSQSGRDHLGKKHLEELELMVEMAIATAVNAEKENLANQLVDLSQQLRRSEYRN